MLPTDLKPEQFAKYPPQARELAIEYLGTLQRLPLSFLPGLLREVIDYDFKFPAERKARERELAYLSSLSPSQLTDCVRGFKEIVLSPQLESSDWAGAPAQFVEQLSAHLWSSRQLDAFRKASNEYAERLRSAVPAELPPVPRLGITVVGQGVSAYDAPLFRNLRARGAYFSQVKPENGMELLLAFVAARAKAHPSAYAHWYIDGGQEAAHDSGLTCISYRALQPVRAALLRKMRAQVERPGMGPEALRSILAATRPEDLAMGGGGSDHPRDEVLNRFQLSLLTEASGTQIFSTTFAQWSAREALRRAQPLTLLVRFAPRQRQKPMYELLSGDADGAEAEKDYLGSLIDADMGAYYNWLNQQRLPGAEQSSFLVWFEDHGQALAIGPSMARGTVSSSTPDLRQLLSWTM